MALNPNEDTEFNDALRKHGILPPRPKTPDEPSPPPSPTLSEELDDLDIEGLKVKEDEANDSDTERLVSAYRRRKLAELQKEQKKARFGRVYPIGRDDYTREVTEASKQDTEGETESIKGTGVVCFLYKDGQPASERLSGYLHILAERYPKTKFVSIVGDKCIPNCPDRNLPMMILYRHGGVIDTLVAWGANPTRPGTLQDVETVLTKLRIIASPPVDVPKLQPENQDENEREPEPNSIRSKSKKDEDSDSDFDL